MTSSLISKPAATRGAGTTSFLGTESTYDEPHERSSSSSSYNDKRPEERTKVVSKKMTQTSAQGEGDPVYVWSSLIAGVGSGALSSIMCAPLDLIRTRLQVWSDLNMPAATIRQAAVEILNKEGWQGYFRGLGASLCTVPAFWGVYFPLYGECKRKWAGVYPHTNPSAVHCGSAVLAGAVSDLICNPMFVVRTRLQTEALHNIVEGTTKRRPSGIVRTVRALYHEGGVPIFWRGMTANLMGLSHVAVQFPVYEWLKKELTNQRKQRRQHLFGNTTTPTATIIEPTALDLFLASGLSKMVASLLTYPHEVIRSRMMDARGATGTTLWYTASRVYAQDGIRGFYSGLPVALVRVIPNCCITFMTYELLLRFAKEEIRKHRGELPSQLTANDNDDN